MFLCHLDRNENGSLWHQDRRLIVIVVALLAEGHNPCIVIWAIQTINPYMGPHNICRIGRLFIISQMRIYRLTLTWTGFPRFFLPVFQEGIIAIRNWLILRIKNIMHKDTTSMCNFALDCVGCSGLH